MDKSVFLQAGKFYHIYNCGINGADIFRSDKDHQHFLRLYERYCDPVFETYAWVLMKNHFHFLLKIKENLRYKFSNAHEEFSAERFNEIKWETVEASGDDKGRTPKGHLHLSHLFNAYAKYFNRKYHRHGSLFERPFKRKEVDHRRYFRSLVVYIHHNPVHHGFCEHPIDYGWSSYLTILSIKPTRLDRDEVIGWFDDRGNFMRLHGKEVRVEEIEDWLGL